MTIKFDLAFANWLAQVIDPSVSFSKLDFSDNGKEKLTFFLQRMIDDSRSFLKDSEQASSTLENIIQRIDVSDENSVLEAAYTDLQFYLRHKHWVAFIVPSGIDPIVDNILCDPELLGYLVKSSGSNQGLVLQLDADSEATSALLDVHEVWKTALIDLINWPGVLVWQPGGDSVFIPINSLDSAEIDIEARVQWVFSTLFSSIQINLGCFKSEYIASFPEVFEHQNSTVHILHLSDLAIGSKVSSKRLMRMEKTIRQVVEELREGSKIIPVISGNLMDNPSENNLPQVQKFWEFISSLGTESPLFVLGENDVRKDGNINENYQAVVGFPVSLITWYEEERIAFICVNSVSQGQLKSGSVGVEQLADITYELERKQDYKEYKFIVLLHHPFYHHTLQPRVTELFYDKVFGSLLPNAEVLGGASLLAELIEKQGVSAVFHGHQKTPSIRFVDSNVPIIACGGTNGCISKTDGSVYFSMNVSSINQHTDKISSRLLAIRKPEQGLVEQNRHEIIFRGFI